MKHVIIINSSDIANDLGSVIAAETPCGMTYDQDAIGRFITERVPATDMAFDAKRPI